MAAAFLLSLLAATAPAPMSGGVRMWTDAPAGPRTSAPPAIPALLKSAMPGVVGIVATTARAGAPSADPFHDFLEKMYGGGAEHDAQPVRGIGTGFFIRPDGLIATNNHVIEGATDLAVQAFSDSRVYRATVVGRDEATDLALIKVEGAAPFPVLPLGDSDAAEVGEWVVAIGNPFGLSRSVTTGIISYKGRRDVNPSGKPGYYDFIQTDAAINPGNSGGPLLDARGAVVAINAAVNPTGQGIGFAVPINMLKELAPQLEVRGRVQRGWMGLTIQDELSPDLAESFGVPSGRGVVVTEVATAGPAALAGIRPGDVVTAFDGEPLAESWRLRWLTSLSPPGRAVKLALWRAGAARAVQVVLQEKPGEKPDPTPIVNATGPQSGPFGMLVEDLREAEGRPARHGVRVSSLDVRGSAFRAGLREGDHVLELDGEPVDARASFEHLALTAAKVTRLFVRRGNRVLFFALRRDKVPKVHTAGEQQAAASPAP